jgi:hypothetical protein
MFEDIDGTSVTRSSARPHSLGALWWANFSATFCAGLLVCAIAAVGLRLYVHWSIASAVQEIGPKLKESADKIFPDQRKGR